MGKWIVALLIGWWLTTLVAALGLPPGKIKDLMWMPTVIIGIWSPVYLVVWLKGKYETWSWNKIKRDNIKACEEIMKKH